MNTTSTTNEAAERRKRNHFAADLADYMAEDDWDQGITLLDQALADEHRATVKRIRAAVNGAPGVIGGPQMHLKVLAILDEEAAR